MRGLRINLIPISILVMTIVLAPVAYALVNDVVVNTSDRTWLLEGSITFTVAEGSTVINGVEIGPGDVVSVQFDNINSTEDYVKIWIGTDGWVDITVSGERGVLLVNGEEVASDDWQLNNVRADLTSIESTLVLTVPSEDPGWTCVRVDGEVVLRGDSEDEIVVVGIYPTESVALNLNTDDEYLRSAAYNVEINGQEVPLVTPNGLAAIAVVALLALVVFSRRS